MSAAQFITLVCVLGAVAAENAGWMKYFEENPTEFHDLTLTWERNGSTVPDWMGGTYVRNGPAQLHFGKDKHFLGSWLDGFAKLHSFKLRGKDQVLFSGKMVESTTYKDSVAAGTLAPQLTLNKFKEGTPEWSWWDLLKIAKKAAANNPEHLAFDNSNPAIWSLKRKNGKHVYMATTDYPVTTEFDISNLDTLGMLIPPHNAMTSCAHWMYEPGTENSINFRSYTGLRGSTVEVHRYTPEYKDFNTYETVAKFKVSDMNMLHSFSITENYSVFMFYPLFMDMMKAMTSNFHILEAAYYKEDADTHIYIVNMKTGAVQKISSKTLFSYHHINAYETHNGTEIVLDMSPSNPDGLHDYPKLENMLNPAPEWTGINGSTTGPNVVTRYHINLQTSSVSTSTFPNTIDSIYINRFDFPTINEAYRGKQYCIIYGVSAFDYSRTALVKKNTCDGTQDKIRYIEDHYASEMSFIPNPEGNSEDDGVLVTLLFDGTAEQSYLLILDAVTFTELDRAWLPHNIPWSAHGLHFPEAQF